MYNDEQEEEVEEEEEFHEVEEEKHKTSQESVGGDKTASSTQVQNDTKQQKLNKEPTLHKQQEQFHTSPSHENDSENPQLQPEQPTIQNEQPLPESTEQLSDDDAIREPTANNAHTPVESCSERVASPEKERSDSQTPTVESLDIDATQSDQHNSLPTIHNSQSSEKEVDWADIMLISDKQNDAAQLLLKSSSSAKDDTLSESVKSLDKDIQAIIDGTENKLKIEDVDETGISHVEDSFKSAPCATATPRQDGLVSKTDDSTSVTGTQSPNPVDPASTEPGELKQDVESEKAEEVVKKELDLDEDVKNPQYIPKKGVFYEHDDRSHDAEDKKPISSNKKDEDSNGVKEQSKKPNTVQEKQNENRRGNRRQRTEADRWNHDLFRDEKQKPKSKSELINAYGYDIRQEKNSRNQETRPSRGGSNNNIDRPQGSLENQRTRQVKDVKHPRQNQLINRSRERKPKRQNARNNRSDATAGSFPKRDAGSRLARNDTRDSKDQNDDKQTSQPPFTPAFQLNRREPDVNKDNRGARNDSRGRHITSRDRPIVNAVDEKLPPANTVMPPITTWSSEDMAKAEAFNKDSPPRHTQNQLSNNSPRNNRTTDYWQQGQANKGAYHDRTRNSEDTRQNQHHNSRPKYQDRGDDIHKSQSTGRNQFNERSSHYNQDWHRMNNFHSFGPKPNDYVVKTQTFENSRLSQQAGMNRSNSRDLREILNERRTQGQQNIHTKGLSGQEQHIPNRGQSLNTQHLHQFVQHQNQHLMHQHMIHQQAAHSMPLNQRQQQQPQPQQQHQLPSQHPQTKTPQPSSQQQHHSQQQSIATQVQRQQLSIAQSTQQHPQPQQQSQQPQPQHQQQPQHQNQRQPQHSHPSSQPQLSHHQTQSRQSMNMSNVPDGNTDAPRLTSNVATNDMLASRPIIKTDAYTTASVTTHQQPSQTLTQHSQNHRPVPGALAQQGANPAGSHMIPQHLGAAGSQAQYYQPSANSRDPTAAAMASAYHGYMPSGHSVMDTSRYHMTSQQMSDHGYMTSPGQTNDVGVSVMHQPGMYSDGSGGGTVASSAYLAQAGSTLSPTTNIPVTGAGPHPLPPVSYLQHSQYPPPPYSNPYSQPQHNQAPPQSGPAYPPYWTYI